MRNWLRSGRRWKAMVDDVAACAVSPPGRAPAARDERDEFRVLCDEAEDSLRQAVSAFAEWFAREWQITPAQWEHDYADPPPGGQEWFDGHNTGVEGALIAVDTFLDEHNVR
jgi:hypothetical protein